MPGLSPIQYFIRLGAALSCVLLAVWFYVLAFPMAFLESGYPSWIAKLAMLRDCRLGSISFFGNSRIEAGVLPAILPVDASNFGVAAGTPIEVHAAVQRAVQCEHLPKYVVISLGAEDFGPLSQYFWVNSVRYGFIERHHLSEIERTADQVGDDVTLKSAKTSDGMSGPMRDWLYAIHFPSLYFNNLVQGQIFRRYQGNRERLARVLRDRGFVAYERQANAVEQLNPGATLPRVTRTPLHTAYFERTLQILLDHRLRVGLLLTPVSKTRGTTPAPETEATHVDYLKSLTTRFPNVQLINAESPRWPGTLFADGIHLAPAGARMFTAELAACVEGMTIRAGCNLDWPEHADTTPLLDQGGLQKVVQVQ